MIKKLVFRITIIFLWLILLSFILFDDAHSYTRIMLHEMYYYKDNIDVVLLGASHVYRGIDPNKMTEKIGLNVFNASTSSQQLQGSYYLLKEIIKTNDIKICFLDVNYGINNLEEDGDVQTFLITDYMNESIDKYCYLFSSLGVDGIISSFFPIFHSREANPITNLKNKFSSSYSLYKYDYVRYPNEEYRGNGFVYNSETIDCLNTNWAPNQFNGHEIVPDYTKHWLDQIVELCEKKNIELILIDCPITDASVYSEISTYDEYIVFFKEYAEKNNIQYWNFNLMSKKLINLDYTDFMDAVHMNGSGAEKFTDFLSNYYIDNSEYQFYGSLLERFDKGDYDKTYRP